MNGSDNKYAVPALERGLKLLQLFDRERFEWAPPEIARALDLPRATVFRMIQTLESLDFLERHGTLFRLGPAVLRLGFEYLASLELTELARPVIERLRNDSGCASQLVIRDRREVVVVFKASTASMFASNVTVGTRFPAHATILGRVLLCELRDDELARLFPEPRLGAFSPTTPKTLAALKRLLADDRRRGYIVSESFFERGISAVAAPVRDQHSAIVAAVSVTVQQPSLDPPAFRDRLVAHVVQAAGDVSHRLNFRPGKAVA